MRPMLGPNHPAYGTTEADAEAVVSSNGSGHPAEVTLPALPEVRRWVTRTRQDRAALQARADLLKLQFEPLRRELAGVERSIKVLDHFLAQVAVAGDDAAGAAQPNGRQREHRGRPLPDGQWSRKFAACQGCGTIERKHKAGGLCGLCYDSPTSRRLPAPADEMSITSDVSITSDAGGTL
jgi:hypothetical protein